MARKAAYNKVSVAEARTSALRQGRAARNNEKFVSYFPSIFARAGFCAYFILLTAGACLAQGSASEQQLAPEESFESSPAGDQIQPDTSTPAQSGASSSPSTPNASGAATNGQTVPLSKQQPKRILGVMPNYRAVSAGAIPPPPTLKEAFKIATQNSFDYSSFVFVGITSLLAEASDSHPQLGHSVTGFGRYYWRGFVDKTDGNYLVIFALPTIFHQDERYYARGKGSIVNRGVYAGTRIFITPDYHGHNSFNVSELLGRGIAQGISLTYYPSGTRTASALATKYGWALGRDALTNVFREFWPDIATHVLHRHP